MNDFIDHLRRAVPYIRLYKDRTFVVKVGGRILDDPAALDHLAHDMALFHQLGIRVVLVHGGGPQATRMSEKLGLEPRIVAGRRVTDAATLEVVKMVYGGTLNLEILAALRRHQTSALGLSGVDGGMIQARRRPPRKLASAPGEDEVEVDFGFVGDIERVDPSTVVHVLRGGLVPVVASLAATDEGVILNVNADSIAQALACALDAEKLLILTDTDGVLRDPSNPSSLVSYTDIDGIEDLRARGALAGGMLPKVEACIGALRGGVRRTHVINGMRPGSLILEVFTNAGCGTMIVDRLERESYQTSELDPA